MTSLPIMLGCNPEAAEPVPTEPHAIVVTDSLGRTVQLAAAPRRIVSLAPANTEMLFAIGAGEQLVGVTKYANFPPAALAIPHVGGFSANSINLETVVSLKPDVVFAEGDLHRTLIARFEQLKIPVIAFDPETLDDVYENIRIAGVVTQRSQQADEVVAKMQDVVASIPPIPTEGAPKVLYLVWDNPLMTAGRSSFIHQLITLAGGQNIFADVEEAFPQVSEEAILQRNPDVIIAPSRHGEADDPQFIVGRTNWQNISAVQSGRVYFINEDWVSRPGPRLVEGLKAISETLQAIPGPSHKPTPQPDLLPVNSGVIE